MNLYIKRALTAAALASLPLISACGAAKKDGNATGAVTATKEEASVTLAGALNSEGNMATLQNALTKSDLTGVFDGPASYTLLAPNDAAFKTLGDKGTALLTDEQRPLLVGIIRDHLLPGYITPEQIGDAIKKKGGPVTMATFGEGKVTFVDNGGKIRATLENGTSADIVGTPVATSNGVVIPVDTVLVPKEG